MDQKSYDEVDTPPHSYHVTYLDLGIMFCSIILHFIDVGYDIYLAQDYYYTTEKYSYFIWTIAFILLPSVILTLISIRMYEEDNEDRGYSKHSVVRMVLCALGFIFQLALPIRYIDSTWYAIKSLKAERQANIKQQKKYYLKMLKEDSDVALLKVFECYTESAPQLVLQITLLVTDYIEGSYVHTSKQIGFIILGFLSMGLCMTNYHRCIRFDQEKKNISALGTTVQFLWHLNFTVSRIMAISGLATLYGLWTCIGVLVHWCIMTIWVIVSSQTKFCGENKIFEFFFNAAGGIVYIFNFLNMKEGSTKKSYFFFYLFCFVENIISATIWGLKSPNHTKNWIYYIFIIFPIVCFLLGVGFLILYYQYLHPNKLKPNTESNKHILFIDNKQDNVHDQRITLTY